MKKILYLILLCSFVGLIGCNSKEEAMAETREVPCEMAGISFTFNGLWIQQSEEELNAKVEAGQTVVLSAYKEETGSGINIICEDLTKTEGGTLVRMDDYVSSLQEQLQISNDYDYSCSEISAEKLCGNSYETFSVTVSELDTEQQYYIRRQDDTMIIMIITVFGEDKLEDVLSLMSPM